MSFENELEKRLESARQIERSKALQAQDAKAKEELLIQTKDVIYSVLAVVSSKFSNASVEYTHKIDSRTNEVIFRMGIGNLCVIDFSPDATFDFYEPCRVAFTVKIEHDNNVEIAVGYVKSKEALKNYQPILQVIRNPNKDVYRNQFDSAAIKAAVEKEIIEILDAVRN